MKIISAVLFFTIIINSTNYAQPDDIDAMRFAKTITAEDLKKHLFIIAGPEMEGRETGTEGQRKAADYISNQFKLYDLTEIPKTTDYKQQYPLYIDTVLNCTFATMERTFVWKNDFNTFINLNETGTVFADEIIFAGYGIKDSAWNDYDGIDVKNKIVLILTGEPKKKDKYVISNSSELSTWGDNFRKKVDAARIEGAAGIIFLNLTDSAAAEDNSQYRNKSRMYVKKEAPSFKNPLSIIFRRNIAYEFLGDDKFNDIERRIKKGDHFNSFTIKGKCVLDYKENTQEIFSSNIIGFVEGSDHKDETIFITAHYDHLGKRDTVIYYGADDDGSGTVSVLEIAQAFAKAKSEGHGPRRSIVFMTVSGEEKGLLGSKYYTEHPLLPLENVVIDLNTDMIGRIDKEHARDTNYIYIVGDDKMSSELHLISEKINATYTKFHLDYTYNDPKDPERIYYRSDHYNFVKKGIPIIFYFDGIHEDYHKPTDTPDKINYSLMAKRSQFVFFTAWELANRNDRLILDKRDSTDDSK